MGKYASGLTISDICRLEVEEASGILANYKVSKEETEIITGMIKEAYFQCSKAASSGRALERLVEELTGEEGSKKYFKRYMELMYEEEVKFPFMPEEDEDDV